MIEDFLHLTWRGRLSMIWYPIRGLFVRPAPWDQRCMTGSYIGEHVWCPRYTAPGEWLWCKRHAPD